MNYHKTRASMRRFVRFNRLSLVILAGLLLFGLANWQLTKLRTQLDRISVIRESDGGVTFSSNDGPFVITHLVYKGWYVAQLPNPVVLIESGRTGLDAEVVNTLIWRETRDRTEVEAPPKTAPLAIIYSKAQWTRFSEDDS